MTRDLLPLPVGAGEGALAGATALVRVMAAPMEAQDSPDPATDHAVHRDIRPPPSSNAGPRPPAADRPPEQSPHRLSLLLSFSPDSPRLLPAHSRGLGPRRFERCAVAANCLDASTGWNANSKPSRFDLSMLNSASFSQTRTRPFLSQTTRPPTLRRPQSISGPPPQRMSRSACGPAIAPGETKHTSYNEQKKLSAYPTPRAMTNTNPNLIDRRRESARCLRLDGRGGTYASTHVSRPSFPAVAEQPSCMGRRRWRRCIWTQSHEPPPQSIVCACVTAAAHSNPDGSGIRPPAWVLSFAPARRPPGPTSLQRLSSKRRPWWRNVIFFRHKAAAGTGLDPSTGVCSSFLL
ncbi:hypothetical protein C8Q79DRAFT_314392 [Trametes meyenii]|nr:hypothetical protein C8Q79DRAFT_314392 [Trametes meyenii]